MRCGVGRRRGGEGEGARTCSVISPMASPAASSHSASSSSCSCPPAAPTRDPRRARPAGADASTPSAPVRAVRAPGRRRKRRAGSNERVTCVPNDSAPKWTRSTAREQWGARAPYARPRCRPPRRQPRLGAPPRPARPPTLAPARRPPPTARPRPRARPRARRVCAPAKRAHSLTTVERAFTDNSRACVH